MFGLSPATWGIITGVVRAAIPVIVGGATYWQTTNPNDTGVAGVVSAGIMAAWSAYSNKQSSLITTINKTDNGVKVVDEKTTSAPPVNIPSK